jgi:hypothetical protein
MNNRNRNRSNNINRNISLPKGGVSLESGRGYRGSVTVNGKRHRTRRHSTKSAALRELNAIRGELMEAL